MARPLPRFLETHQTRLEHARKLERIIREADGDLRGLHASPTAADNTSLRGIPAIGHVITGVIAGTNPRT